MLGWLFLFFAAAAAYADILRWDSTMRFYDGLFCFLLLLCCCSSFYDRNSTMGFYDGLFVFVEGDKVRLSFVIWCKLMSARNVCDVLTVVLVAARATLASQ